MTQFFPQEVTAEAHQTRVEVEALERTLGHVAQKIKNMGVREKNIFSNFQQAQKKQASFHDRVEQSAESLRRIKSLLAEFNS